MLYSKFTLFRTLDTSLPKKKKMHLIKMHLTVQVLKLQFTQFQLHYPKKQRLAFGVW